MGAVQDGEEDKEEQEGREPVGVVDRLVDQESEEDGGSKRVSGVAPSKCDELQKGLTSTQKLLVLCALAFCLGCQPSEPFLTPYMAEDKGLNSSQIDDQVYPFWTWSYFVVLLPVGMSQTNITY